MRDEQTRGESADVLDIASIEYLVFAGGGMRGLAYGGALAQLAREGLDMVSMNRPIKGVAGTSIGALFAAMIAVRMTPECILREIHSFQVNDLFSIDPCTLFYSLGFDEGARLTGFLHGLLRKVTGREDLTLRELFLLSKLKLVIPVTNLNSGTVEYISHESDPEMSLVELLRMTMGIPIVFSPRKWKGSLYVDGGIMDNYPISQFPAHKTLGLKVFWSYSFRLDSLDQYVARVVYCALYTSEKVQWQSIQENMRRRTAEIDVGDICTVEFKMTESALQALVHKGELAVKRLFRPAAPLDSHTIGMAITSAVVELQMRARAPPSVRGDVDRRIVQGGD